MGILDFLWLTIFASSFYKKHIGDLLEFNLIPAILFYFTYTAGIIVFVNGNVNATLQSVLLYGALFGFFAYATYDLTNLATLRGWSQSLVIVDITWGVFITAAASAGGFLISRFFK